MISKNCKKRRYDSVQTVLYLPACVLCNSFLIIGIVFLYNTILFLYNFFYTIKYKNKLYKNKIKFYQKIDIKKRNKGYKKRELYKKRKYCSYLKIVHKTHIRFIPSIACFVPYYIRYKPNIIRYKTRQRYKAFI